jgi:hypothetical protein
MSELCLTLLCPPALEERVLDLLLMTPEVAVFTSTAAAAHGLSHARLSANEQVLGLAVMTQVQALLTLADRDRVLASLKRELAGTGLHYWLTPVIEAGELA